MKLRSLLSAIIVMCFAFSLAFAQSQGTKSDKKDKAAKSTTSCCAKGDMKNCKDMKDCKMAGNSKGCCDKAKSGKTKDCCKTGSSTEKKSTDTGSGKDKQ